MDKESINSLQIQEKGRISVIQLAYLMVTLVIATADVFLPAFVAQEAKQDSWISVFLGTASSLLIINIFLFLGLRYPDKTIIQYACDILGKVPGKLVGAAYVYYFLFISWAVNRELSEIFIISFNPSSPILVYTITATIVAAYAVYKGLEVIARINEIMLPIGLVILVFVAVSNIPNMDFNFFLPVMYNGFTPVWKGALLIQAWLVETVLILQFIPFTTGREKIRKYLNLSVLILAAGLLVGVLTIAVFGPFTQKLLFPALDYVRIASLGTYIENLDITIMVVWIAGMFIKTVLAYYAAALGTAQLFGFSSYRWVILPLGLVIICFSIVSAKMLMNLIYFIRIIFPFYSLLMAFVLPVLLLAVSLLKGKRENSRSASG